MFLWSTGPDGKDDFDTSSPKAAIQGDDTKIIVYAQSIFHAEAKRREAEIESAIQRYIHDGGDMGAFDDRGPPIGYVLSAYPALTADNYLPDDPIYRYSPWTTISGGESIHEAGGLLPFFEVTCETP